MEQVELSYSNLMSYTLCYAWYMLGRVLRMSLSLLQLHKSSQRRRQLQPLESLLTSTNPSDSICQLRQETEQRQEQRQLPPQQQQLQGEKKNHMRSI